MKADEIEAKVMKDDTEEKEKFCALFSFLLDVGTFCSCYRNFVIFLSNEEKWRVCKIVYAMLCLRWLSCETTTKDDKNKNIKLFQTHTLLYRKIENNSGKHSVTNC